MDSLTKLKILVGVVCAILILCVFFLFSGSSDKDKEAEKQEADVSLRSKETTMTINEMMAANEDNAGKDNGTTDYNRFGGAPITDGSDQQHNGSTQNEADIEALQAQLRANLTNSVQSTNEAQVSTPPQQAPATYYTPQQVQQPRARRYTDPAPEAETYDRLSTPSNAIPAKTAQAAPAPQKPKSRFFNGKRNNERTGNSISAVVHGEQTVTAGGTLKMRLLENLTTETGVTIPKGTFIYGTVSFSGERMRVMVTSVRLGKTREDVAEQVYDEDGQMGIYVPQNAKSEASKTITDEAVNSTNVETSSGGLVGGVVSGVSNAIKNVIGRNTAKQKVTVKSNYRIYLIHEEKD